MPEPGTLAEEISKLRIEVVKVRETLEKLVVLQEALKQGGRAMLKEGAK